MLMNQKLDPMLQFKIFDMLDDRPVRVIDDIDKEKFKFCEESL